MNTIYFKEVQRFKTLWAWLGVGALNCLFLYAVIQQIIIGKAFGPKPAPDFVLIILEAFMLALLLFLISIKLKTRITEEGVYYRVYSFQFKETEFKWHSL